MTENPFEIGTEKYAADSELNARKREVTIRVAGKSKLMVTPGMFVEPKNSRDLDTICKWVEETKPHNFAGIVLPISKYQRITTDKESTLGVKSLSGQFREQTYRDIKYSKIILIDPESENLYRKLYIKHDVKNKNQLDGKELRQVLEALRDLPQEYIDSVIWKPQNRGDNIVLYKSFLSTLEKKVHSYTTGFLRKEKMFGADIIIPPTPLIIPEAPNSMELAMKINKEASQICDLNNWPCSAYFLLRVSMFEDWDLVKPIIQYIDENKPRMVFIKLLDSYRLDNRNAAIQRHNLHMFLKNLSIISKKFKIPVIWLNLDSLGVFMLMAGIDGFSTPTDGFLERIIAFPKHTELPDTLRGNYFLYQVLSFVPFRALMKMYIRNGKKLPCHTGCCDKYNGTNLELDPRVKARMCRIHYLCCLDTLTTEAHDAINNDVTRQAINKLANSSCKHYLEILNGIAISDGLIGKK